MSSNCHCGREGDFSLWKACETLRDYRDCEIDRMWKRGSFLIVSMLSIFAGYGFSAGGVDFRTFMRLRA